MAATNVVSFDDALRARERDVAYISDEELRRTQSVIDLDDCHVALERCTVIMKAHTHRYALFKDLTAAFPKGRRIAILGHKGSGKTVLTDIMLKRRTVNAGRVIVTSRMSWSVSYMGYLDGRLSLKQNLVFLGHVFKVDPSYLMGAICDLCNLGPKQLNERLSNFPVILKRRIGLLMYLLGDFDCHVIDGPFRGVMFGANTDRLQAMVAAVTARDFIATVTEARQTPSNCDLAYILYNGRLFMFEDVAMAIEIYNGLPVPENPNPLHGKDDKDDENGQDETFEFAGI